MRRTVSHGRTWTILVGALGVLFGVLAAARAQPTASPTLDDLRREIAPGDRVTIVQASGDAVSGRVRRVGTTEMDLRTKPATTNSRNPERLDLTIPLSTIESLERRRDSTANGTLIGAGVGAGVALGFFVHAYAVDANEMDEWASGYAIAGVAMTGIGALVGWAIDAAHSKPAFRYQASPRAGTTVRAVPLFAHGPGVGIVVRF